LIFTKPIAKYLRPALDFVAESALPHTKQVLAEERPVVIQADRRVTTDVLVRVMDEAKLGGAQSLSISTTLE